MPQLLMLPDTVSILGFLAMSTHTHTHTHTHSNLSGITNLQVVILNTFSSQSEEVRSAASYALGQSHTPSHIPLYRLPTSHPFKHSPTFSHLHIHTFAPHTSTFHLPTPSHTSLSSPHILNISSPQTLSHLPTPSHMCTLVPHTTSPHLHTPHSSISPHLHKLPHAPLSTLLRPTYSYTPI